MKIYVSHSKDFDFEKELYEPLRSSELAKKHEFFFPHDNGQRMNVRDILESCNLVLAEVSRPATGQGIELGWANAAKVPILCVSKMGVKTSGSLSFITNDFLSYADPEDLVKQLAVKI